MAKIFDLPNELLAEIWSHVEEPKDIENFALTSKVIRSQSGKILQGHRKLTQAFSKFVIGGQNSRVSAAGLLKKILKTPQVALYVREITVNSCNSHWSIVEKGVNPLMALDPEAGDDGCCYRHTPYGDKDMTLFKQAAQKVEDLLGRFDSHIKYGAETLIRKIKDGAEQHVIAIILLVLPNLESLIIENHEFTFRFTDILSYISDARGKEALRRLIDVKVWNMPAETDPAYWRAHKLPDVTPSAVTLRPRSAFGCEVTYTQFNLPIWSLSVKTLTCD